MNYLLLVEDDSSHAELISRAFDAVAEGWTVLHASSLAEAQKHLQTHLPTLAIADFRLPDGRGDHLVTLAQGAFPVVLLTAFGSEQMAVEVIKAGALDYIVKSPEAFADIPFRANRVLAEWNRLQAQRKSSHRLERLNQTLLALDPDHQQNIQRLTALAGELLEGRLALFARYQGPNLFLAGRWRTPESIPLTLSPPPCLCTPSANATPAPSRFLTNLEHCAFGDAINACAELHLISCLGHHVQGPHQRFGLLCVLYEHQHHPTDNDRHVLGLLASALAVEEARRLAQEQLRLSEERFRTLLHNIPSVAVQGYSPDGTVHYRNRGSELLYLYTAQEATGRNLLNLIVPPQLQSDLRQAIQTMALSGIPIPPGERELLRQDGSPVPVLSSHAAVALPNGLPLLFSVDVDLTSQRRAEQDRLEIERQLLHTQKLESLGVLAGGIAHDFNNLLTSMLGNIGLALMDLSELSPARHSILEAEKAIRRAADLTRQMLAYSGRGLFQVGPLDLTELVEEMAHLLKVSIAKTATLHLNLDRHLPPILADAAQVQQIVMNLITNASEALGDQVGSIVITTSNLTCDDSLLAQSRLADPPPPGHFVSLEVTDTGCGMDPTVQQRLFDPFFTTKFTGRGLGMSAVLGAVRGHKGAILVRSAAGQGSTIQVLFPASTAPAPSRPASPQPQPPQPPPLPTTTVLVADDEPQVRALAERALSRAGFQVLTAADGREAVRLFQQHPQPIACAILDLTMPNLDGVKTFEALRKLQPTLPAILASGYDQHELQGRFDGLGFAAFVQKPFEIEKLVQAVHRLAHPPLTSSQAPP